MVRMGWLRMGLRPVGLAAAALALAALLAVTPAAAGRARCFPAAGSLYPVLIAPCNGATVQAGHDITFRARDRNSKSGRYRPFIELTHKRPRHGKLPTVPGSRGFFAQMHRVRGHRGVFAYRPPAFSYPGWWLVTPGTYYVQVQQVDARCAKLACYGPISKIHVR